MTGEIANRTAFVADRLPLLAHLAQPLLAEEQCGNDLS